MKFFKSVIIKSDGSIYFSKQKKIDTSFEYFNFQLFDDKNFFLNKKKLISKRGESKQSLILKKKYLKKR